MTKLLPHLKIAHKLLLTELVMTLSMLLVFIVFAFGSHYHNLRTNLIRDILVQMNVAAQSIGPAILMDELNSATRILDPLTDNHNIRSIVIMNQQQQPLKSLRSEHPQPPAAWHWLYPYFSDLEVSTPIMIDDTVVGTLHASVKQSQIVDMLISFAWSNAIAVLAAALTGCLIMWRLNRNIIDPIHDLHRFVGNITRNHHYEQRVNINSSDEIGMLGNDINNMLESINQRDLQLLKELEHRKVIEEKLQFLAHYDKNTELLNRHAFEEAITSKMTASVDDSKQVYLLLLDLDRFKIVNDSFGHATGDKLLLQVAHRLRGNLSQHDDIFRLGGDEFAILLEAAGRPAIERVCKRIIQTISAQFIVDEHEIHIGVSIGIALLRQGFDSKTEVMKNADVALYQAKDAGRNTFRFYSELDEASTSELRSMREELHFALQNHELEIHYQPIIHTQLIKTIGFEALLRWRHPNKGLLNPDQFIALAEGSGLIVSIGAWVIHQSLKQLTVWQEMFDGDLFMNVNISSRQLDDEKLSDTIRHALDYYQLSPRSLNLEITESMVMRNIESAKQTLYALKQLGIGIAIDDFGIGHSSMNYLKQLPIDILKIDKQFTAGIPHDKVDIAIVDALVALAVSLNLKVVAEGVESAIQFEYLQYKLCHHVQGYLFSAALSASQTTTFLAEFPESIPASFRHIAGTSIR